MSRLPKIFFITGFMGVGKTYWARRISKQLNVAHYDTDNYIVHQEQQSIQAIINEDGQAGFRQLEKEALRKIIDRLKHDAIISLGGGTLLDKVNLSFVKEHGTLIWLKKEATPLQQGEIDKRPLYDKEKIDELYLERKTSYLKSDIIIDLQKIEGDEEIERILIQYISDGST